ncbi:hypothetical protein PHLH3_30250 [Pseudomonas sp. St386]|nr:hypothetical protein PFLU4_12930 [Pseudomonas fluorescens]RDI04721.1 hypothetical protein DFO59_10439 [Pseudomonas fluorescens]BBP53399.1 hypothetical protein PHLH3_30250 [Pseudomonas sp. St386]SDP46507.1 hypothetical protein SAMN04490180_1469 [Pseudomonas brassicacearum]
MTATPEILGHLWRGSLLPHSGSKLPRHNSLLIEAWSGC